MGPPCDGHSASRTFSRISVLKACSGNLARTRLDDLLAVLRPPVHSARKDAGDGKVGIQPLLDQLDRLPELGKPVEAHDVALDGNEDLVHGV